MSRLQTLVILELVHFLAVLFNTEGKILLNIAEDKSATHYGSARQWPASNAVDGKTDCGTINNRTLTVSGQSTNPWWQVDLGVLYNIQRIEVYGRADGHNPEQLQGFHLFLSTVSLTTTTNVQPIYTGTDNQFIYNITNLHATATFCRLEVPYGEANIKASGPIVLCEVKIFGTAVCAVGHYGTDCQICGNCSNGDPCNLITGSCPNGCADGYVLSDTFCKIRCPDNKFGRNCSHDCHCVQGSQCDSVSGACQGGCVFGWGGSNCSKDLNIITPQRQFEAQQSSHYQAYTTAEKAIDQHLQVGKDVLDKCSVTDGRTKPWWQINLKERFLLGFAQIFGRSDGRGADQGSNVSVYISNSTMGNDILQGIFIGKFNMNVKIPLNGSRVLQYLLIGRPYISLMTICEVKLYAAVCAPGQFGDVCSTSCHCLDNKTCNDVTGICQTPGCIAGWEGQSCAEECHHGSFGVACSTSCHCFNNTDCDHFSGICSEGRCAPGWRSETCSNECHHGAFGLDCSNSCHCFHNTDCDHFSGICHTGRCAPGWEGNTCSNECHHGTFGLDCRNSCHCFNNTDCDYFSGICSEGRCALGWEGKTCSNECHHGTFGLDCNNSCHCFNNTECDHFSGICSVGRCAPGWQGNTCSNECHHETFGLDCNNTCHCFNNTDCDNVRGICSIGRCAPGWEGNTCSNECHHETFGLDCNNTCHCFNNTDCDHVSGICSVGRCAPGWRGKTCSNECHHQAFGLDCNNTCHCFNNTDCDHFSGICSVGRCAPGWRGNTCSNECHHGTFGLDCNNSCHCFNNTDCDNVRGICSIGRCAPGWEGNTCSNECHHETFGLDCNNTCHCFNNTDCDHVSGICSVGRCAPGWRGKTCSNECHHQAFGLDCNNTCHCFNNTDCDHFSGICSVGRCAPGWRGNTCSNECHHGTFGLDCNNSCHCFNNTDCDHFSGICSVGRCALGWEGNTCSNACSPPQFGKNCSSVCHCVNNSECDHVDGTCDAGVCASGWNGTSCNAECPFHTFGKNCTNSCHCGGNSSCHNENGACLSLGAGCEDGWEGESCSSRTETLPLSATPVAGVVGGSIGAVLVILVVIVAVFVYKKRKAGQSKDSRQASDFSNIQDIPLRSKTPHKPMVQTNNTYGGTHAADSGGAEYYSFTNLVSGIKIHDLWAYIRAKTADDNDFFDKEFQKLPAGLQYSTKVANNPKHVGKNRYKEMYAYDHTRVPLTTESATDSEYINACFVDGYGHLKKFIASQGPTKAMIGDFWRMVWQQKSEKIVMLTNLIEMGTQKCLQYWPETGEECDFGNINIKITSTDTFDDYVIRTLEVNKDNAKSRTIRQFHFKAWPDKDVPDNAWCLVNFWRAIDANARAGAVPIVVHCSGMCFFENSAGVGRTGTFIAMDNLVAQARAEGCVRPLQIVETLRSQRVNMVQTKNQYVYLHEALAEALLVGTHFLCMRHFENVYRFMIQKERRGASKSRIEEQFSLIMKGVETMPSLQPTPSPEYGNIETVLSESDAYRPQLKKRGSNFIQHLGAYFLPNYEDKNTFLVTLSPTDEHMEEFWSLIEEQHIVTVVMLTSTSNHSYKASLKLGSKSGGKPADKFAVNLVQEKTRKGFTEKSFTFRDRNHEDDDYLTTIKQFEYTAWKEGYETPGDTKSMLDLLDAVQHWQPALAESKPILVHCESAFLRSGLVCVLLNEIQRIKKQDGHINIVETVMTMKQRNKDVVHSHEQYRYCYDVLAEYARQTEVYQNL